VSEIVPFNPYATRQNQINLDSVGSVQYVVERDNVVAEAAGLPWKPKLIAYEEIGLVEIRHRVAARVGNHNKEVGGQRIPGCSESLTGFNLNRQRIVRRVCLNILC
jgi:hypothetical protein